jgi:ammonium transporter, Amt family
MYTHPRTPPPQRPRSGGCSSPGLRGRKPSALGACSGAVVGFVAITPPAGYVTIAASLCIGTARLTDLVIPLRVTDEQETVELDWSQHGESATAGCAAQEMNAA